MPSQAMKVAIVGTGNLARYFIEELIAQKHTVVTISRNTKAWLSDLGIPQHTTDYSEASLARILADCDAAVCTIRAGVPEYLGVHKALLAACTASATCRRLIPSTWAGNMEEYPREMFHWSDEMDALLGLLRAQNAVSWTAVCPSWYSDYIVPSKQRHLEDIGPLWPQSYEDKVFTLYGDGSRLVNFTAVRDTVRATIMLLGHDRRAWEPYTYVGGEQATWKELADFIRSRDPGYSIVKKPLAASVSQYAANENELSALAAVFEIYGHSPSVAFPWEKVLRHREKFFGGLKFRTLAELADDAAADPDKVV